MQSGGIGGGPVGNGDIGISEALRARLRRAGFAYAAMLVFYVLDVTSTVLLIATGRFQEANPINRELLDGGAVTMWIVFRLATFAGVTILVATAFGVSSSLLSARSPARNPSIDLMEDGVIGTTILFYALTLFHNLVTAAPVLT
jgi:hypothetical protein